MTTPLGLILTSFSLLAPFTNNGLPMMPFFFAFFSLSGRHFRPHLKLKYRSSQFFLVSSCPCPASALVFAPFPPFVSSFLSSGQYLYAAVNHSHPFPHPQSRAPPCCEDDAYGKHVVPHVVHTTSFHHRFHSRLSESSTNFFQNHGCTT
ncbi:hypothetical protein F5888DRAFT_258546 [Russula emetica]|nr:hypothetical protein F5888DRAFT_258546 [Russula emetica]